MTEHRRREREHVLQEGARAAAGGEHRQTCPYSVHSVDRSVWLEGFDGYIPVPNTEDVPEVECPWCHGLNSDLGEFGEGTHDFRCGHCDRPLTLSVAVSISYTLSPAVGVIAVASEEHEDEW